LSLGNSPLSNTFLKKDELSNPELYYPLDVYICEKCYLAQIDVFELPENIFSRDYAYYSSYSDIWLGHCEEYAKMAIDRFNLNKNSLVVEIASNDGYLLQYFKKLNIPVLGIEPASKTADIAKNKGIPTEVVFFNVSYAKKVVEENRKADLIVGNNVLAHNPAINDFAESISIALKTSGIFTLEFPHLLCLLDNNQFDTIYHEHFSYLSFHFVRELFNRHNLTIFDVEEISTHGGSLRIYGKHKENTAEEITGRVESLLAKEHAAGLGDLKTYYSFGERVYSTRRDLLNLLFGIKDKGKKIVGYGAPAKGNTLLNYCGIRNDLLSYTVDRNPHKQNKYLPGTHIPIEHPDLIREDKPDYLLILPWNIKEEIIKQMSYIKEWDGKFIIPIPKVQVF
jgi:SAM-dependent methyltransferase